MQYHCKLSFFQSKKAKSQDSHLQHGEKKEEGQGERRRRLTPKRWEYLGYDIIKAKTQWKSEA